MNETIVIIELHSGQKLVFDKGLVTCQVITNHIIVMQKTTENDDLNNPWVNAEQSVFALDEVQKYTVKTKTKKYDKE